MGAWITRLAACRPALERSDLLARSGTVMSFIFVTASWLYLFPIMGGPPWHRALAWVIVVVLVVCLAGMLFSDVWPLRLLIVAGLIALSEILAGASYRQDSDSLLLAHSLLIGATSTVALSLRDSWQSGVYTALLGVLAFGHTITTSVLHHLGPTTLLILVGFWLIMVSVRHSAPRVLDTFWRDQAVKAESLAAQEIARERISAAAHDARYLHDTVLRTLTLLARGGAGADPDDFGSLFGAGAYDDGGSGVRSNVTGASVPQEDGRQASTHTKGGVAVVESPDVATLLRRRARGHCRKGFSVDVFGEAGTLPPHVMEALADAAEECVVNAARHAGSDHVDVLVSRAGDLVIILISDSGRGFDPASLPSDSFGVKHSVFERMAQIGGSARLLSAPGRGTTVALEVAAE